jgi:hypothetical protein
LTQLALQTLINRLHRRIYRSQAYLRDLSKQPTEIPVRSCQIFAAMSRAPRGGRRRRLTIPTQIILKTPINRLHRRIYRSPTSGTYQSDLRRCRPAAAGSSRQCHGRYVRTFPMKLGNLIKNGHVYMTFLSIIRGSTLRRLRILNPPCWRQVALQLREARIVGCQPIRGNAAPSDAYRSPLRTLESRVTSLAVPLLQPLGTAVTGKRRANSRSAPTRRASLRT